MSKVICDTSCLIFLEAIDLLNNLNFMFDEVLVTSEVEKEFGTVPSWIKIQDVDSSNLDIPTINLGKGESSSIRLALEVKPTYLILDDKKARKVAQVFKISIIGSLGVLLLAKNKGLVNNPQELVDKINATNFRINPSLIELLKAN